MPILPPLCGRPWSGHVTRMPQEKFARPLLATPKERKVVHRSTRTRWNDYITDLAWSRLGVEPAELRIIDS